MNKGILVTVLAVGTFVAPSFASKIVLGGLNEYGDAFFSKDFGKTWVMPQEHQESISLISLGNGKLLKLNPVGEFGIFFSVSADGGKTWSNPGKKSTLMCGVKQYSTHSHRLPCGPIQMIAHDNQLFAVTYEGRIIKTTISKMTEPGETVTWEYTKHTAPAFRFIASSPDKKLYAIEHGNDRLWISTDNGDTWSLVNGHGYPGVTFKRFAITPATNDAPDGYFVGIAKGIYAATPGRLVKVKLPLTGFSVQDKLETSILFADIAAISSQILVGTTPDDHVWISTDDGKNWKEPCKNCRMRRIFIFEDDKLWSLIPNLVSYYTSSCNDLKDGIKTVKAIGEAAKNYSEDKKNKEKQQKLLDSFKAYTTYRSISENTPGTETLKDLSGFVAHIKTNKQWYMDNCAPDPAIWQEVLAQGAAYVSSVTEAVSKIFEAIKDPTALPGAIFNAAGDVAQQAFSSTKETITVISDAISSALGLGGGGHLASFSSRGRPPELNN